MTLGRTVVIQVTEQIRWTARTVECGKEYQSCSGSLQFWLRTSAEKCAVRYGTARPDLLGIRGNRMAIYGHKGRGEWPFEWPFGFLDRSST